MELETDAWVREFLAQRDAACLNAYLIYEDVATGKKAKEACDVIMEELGAGWKIDCEIASFKLLRLPSSRRKAAVDASKANLVIFSCYQGELPAEVRKWVDTWLTRPVTHSVLVALLAGAPRKNTEPLATLPYLAAAAQRLDLPFFSHSYIMPSGTSDDLSTAVTPKEPNVDTYCANEISGHHASSIYAE